MRSRHATLLVMIRVCVCLFAAELLYAQGDSERQLERVRAEIAAVEAALDDDISRRDDGVAELRAIELSLGTTRNEIASLRDRIDSQLVRQQEIAGERELAAGRLSAEQTALAEQVRVSYMTGREEVLRLLLGNQEPADLSRMLVYYDFLSRHRSEQIDLVATELGRLFDLENEAVALRLELESLRQEQEQRAAELESEQNERRRLIARLDASIEAAGTQIETMREEEAALNRVLTELSERLAAFPVESETPFSEQRGKLPWPVDGRLAGRFGEAMDQDGLVRRHGVLLAAETGTVVRAIYHGQVRYAQWSPGMGLLLIIDHGEGIWSIYGHNSALLRDLGDWVAPGDPIAEVGDTGGQTDPGLYFGIRRDLEPLDPADWVR